MGSGHETNVIVAQSFQSQDRCTNDRDRGLHEQGMQGITALYWISHDASSTSCLLRRFTPMLTVVYVICDEELFCMCDETNATVYLAGTHQIN